MLYNTKTIMSTLKDIYQTYWDGYIENIRNNNIIEEEPKKGYKTTRRDTLEKYKKK